jgi:hypothetical protein
LARGSFEGEKGDANSFPLANAAIEGTNGFFFSGLLVEPALALPDAPSLRVGERCGGEVNALAVEATEVGDC